MTRFSLLPSSIFSVFFRSEFFLKGLLPIKKQRNCEKALNLLVFYMHQSANLVQVKNKIRRLSNLIQGKFFYRFSIFRRKTEPYSKIGIITKDLERKRKLSDNSLVQALKVCQVLAQVCFATSKTLLDIYYEKLCVPVASRVAEQLKTQGILGKYQVWLGTSLVPSIPPKNIFLALKVLWFCLVLLNFLTFPNIFCRILSTKKQIFCS